MKNLRKLILLIAVSLISNTIYSQLNVSITSAESSPTKNSPFQVTITFSGGIPVTNFTVDDIVVGNGSKSGFDDTNNPIFTINIAPISDGTVTVDVGANVCDETNNAAPQFSIVYDGTAPNQPVITTFTDPVNNANKGAITLAGTAEANSTIHYSIASSGGGGPVTGTIAVNGSGSYSKADINVTALGDGTLTATVNAEDAAGNTSVDQTDTATKDVVAPNLYTVSIDQTAIYSGNQTALSFTFASAEIGTTYNFSITSSGGGTAVNGSGTIASANQQRTGINVSGLGDGTLTLSVTLTDAAGNIGSAATNTKLKDVVTQNPTLTTPPTDGADDPTVLIDFTLPEAAQTGTVKMTFTRTGGTNDNNAPHVITFNSNFEGSGQHTTSLNGADLSNNVNVSSVSSNPNDKLVDEAIYSVKIEYKDYLGNALASVTNTSFTYESDPPTADVVDITPDPRNGVVGLVNINFSRAVRVLTVDIGDFTLTLNGVSVNISSCPLDYTGSYSSGGYLLATNYRVDLSSVTSAEGDYVFTIVGGAVSGILTKGGSLFTTSASDDWKMDTTKPDVTISTTAPNPTKTSPIPFTAQFTETVTGFVSGDITVGNGTVTSFSAVDGDTYNFEVTPSANGTVTVDILANKCQDLAANDNNAATQKTIVFDNIAPTLSPVHIQSDNSNNTAYAKDGNTATITFTSSEPIQNVGVTINGIAATSVTGGPTSWTASRMLVGTSEGQVTFNITFEDLAQNTGTPVSSTTDGSKVLFYNTAPTLSSVTIASNYALHTDRARVGSIVSLTFSSVRELDNVVITIAGNSSVASPVGDNYNWTASYTMQSSDIEGAIPFTIDFTDMPENAGTRVTAITSGSNVTFDKTNPTLNSVTIASNNVHPEVVGDNGRVTLTITGSENIEITSATIGTSTDRVATVNGTAPTTNWTAYYDMDADVDDGGLIVFKINYRDLAGNTGSQVTTTTNSSSVTFDKDLPTLPSVSISSDNPDPTRAKVGDVVTLYFNANENIEGVVAKINNKNTIITNTAGDNWTADYTMASSDAEGLRTFTIDFRDYAGNNGAQVTSTTAPFTSVTFDKTKPTLTSVTITSDNAFSNDRASAGDTVLVSFAGSEQLKNVVATILGNPADKITNTSANNWVAKYKMLGTEPEGVIPFTINFDDMAGNSGTQVTTKTTGNNVTFDNTKPTLSNVLISSNNPNSTLAKTGNTITLTFFSSETIQNVVVNIEGSLASLSNSGNSWTATHVLGAEPDGKIDFTIDYEDLFGNDGTQVTTTSNGGKVTIDNTKPTLPTVSISSNNANNSRAKVGDIVTISFTSSEGIKGVSASIDGSAAAVSGNPTGKNWTASYVMQNSNNEGNVSINIAFSDSTGNAGDNVTAITSGTNVRFDKTDPVLNPVTISSNNTDPQRAKSMDEVTIYFTSSEGITNVAATIGGKAATVINTNPQATLWTAKYTLTGSDNEGVLGINISYKDSTGNIGSIVTSTTNSSFVIFDRTTPLISNVVISSSNANTSRAKAGDEISLTFNSSESLITPTVNFQGKPATSIGNVGTAWTATWDQTGATDGIVDFTIDFMDLAYNSGTQVTTTSNGSSVTVDNVVPTLSNVNIVSNNPNTSLAKVGDVITLTFNSSEAITNVIANICGNASTLSSDLAKTTWTGTYVMQSSDPEGIIPIEIIFEDLTGNPGVTVTTTNGSWVKYNSSIPVLNKVTILSNNAVDNQRAKALDLVTLHFESSEGITVTHAKIGGHPATVNGTDGLNWDATYTMQDGDNEGIQSIDIAFQDSAGNVGTSVTTTTNGTSITYDKTPPALYAIAIISDNANTARARSGNNLTLTFKSTETIFTPTVTFNGKPALTVTSAGNSWTATYPIDVSEPDGVVDISIVYDDLTNNPGTIATATTNGSTVTVDNTAPLLTDVSIASNNSTSTLAKVDDYITLNFVSTETIQNVLVNIAGNPATVISNNPAKTSWTATYQMQDSDPEGTILFDIAFDDLTGNIGAPVTVTTNSSRVKFDKTLPTLSSVSISSANATPSLAKVGDLVSINFTSTEGIRNVAALIGGRSSIITGSPDGKTWVASYTMQNIDADGELSIEVSFRDSTGNLGTTINSTNDGSWVIFDKTKPTLSTVSILSDNANPQLAKPGDLITLNFISSEGIRDVSVLIAGVAATVSPLSNTTWTATYTMQSSEPEGIIPFTISFRDSVGNIGTNVSATTDGSTVLFDRTIPTLTSVSIASNYTNANKAKTGSTITVLFTSSESIQAVTSTILGQVAAVTNISGNSWKATLTPLGITEVEGIVPFTIDFADTKGNIGLTVSTVTDGSSVEYDKTLPDLDFISIESDHTNHDKARVGSKVTLHFTSTETIEGVNVKMNNKAVLAENSSGNTWFANYYTSSSDIEGNVGFTIDYKDMAGNSGVQKFLTTDASAVNFDMTKPLITNVYIKSNNADTSLAKVGDIVTLTFKTSEPTEGVDVRFNDIVTPATSPDNISWTATKTMDGSDRQGIIGISVLVYDMAGNLSSTIYNTSNGSSVNFDKTAPVISSITVPYGTYKVGDVVKVTIQADGIDYSSFGTVAVNSATRDTVVNNNNGTYTINYKVEDGDNDVPLTSTLSVNIQFIDKFGNIGLLKTIANVTGGDGKIKIDANVPKINSFISNAETPGILKVGDKILFSLTPQTPETGLIVSPTSYNGINNLVWSTTDGGTTYTASYTVLENTPEWEIPLQLGDVILSDVAGNRDTFSYASIQKQIFTVKPTIEIKGTKTKCYDNIPETITFMFTGKVPFDLYYSINGNADTLVGINTTSYSIQILEGTVSLDSLIDASTNRIYSAPTNATIIVNPLPEVTLNITGSPYSSEAPKDELSKYVEQSDRRNGVFSGEGVGFLSGNYYFYPSTLKDAGLLDQTLPLYYTYTDSNTGCIGKATGSVYVSSKPVNIPDLIDNKVFCSYANPVTYKGILPPDHTGIFQVFDSNDNPVTKGNGWNSTDSLTLEISPLQLPVGNYYVKYIAYLLPQYQEVSSITKNFSVEAKKTGVEILGLETAYCFNSNGPEITVTAPGFETITGDKGRFEGPSVFAIIADSHSAKFKYKEALANSDYTLKYTYISKNGCESDPVSHTVHINPLPEVSFSLLDNYNYNGPSYELNGTPAGGEYNYDNKITTSTTFTPKNISTSLIGANVPFIYKYREPVTGCENSQSASTIIYRATETIQNLNSNYCYQDLAVDISASSSISDTITGSFISRRNALEPNGRNQARYFLNRFANKNDTVYFNYQLKGTSYSVSTIVYIDSIGSVTISGINTDYCVSLPRTEVFGTQNYSGGGSGVYTYSGNQSAFSAFPTSAEIYPTKESPGIYNIKYTFTSNKGCSMSETKYFQIHPLPVPVFDASIPNNIFIKADPIQLSGNYTTGIFSFSAASGVINNIFNPSLTEGGSIPITYYVKDEFGCENQTVKTINVISANASISGIPANGYACYFSDTLTLTGIPANGLSGGEIYGDGVINDGLGADKAHFYPKVAGKGEHDIFYKYKFTDNQTYLIYSRKITVDSTGVVLINGLDDDYTYCASEFASGVQLFSNFSNTIFSGNGIVAKKFYPADAQIGLNRINAEYTNSVTGCKISSYKDVTVNPIPNVRFTVDNTCTDLKTIPVVFSNHTTSIDNVTQWKWYLDGQGVVSSTTYNASKIYSTGGAKQIILSATTDKGCNSTNDTIVYIGSGTAAKFTWYNDCYSTVVPSRFEFTSDTNSVDNYKWVIDGNVLQQNNKAVNYNFPGVGIYDVKLVIKSKDNCKDSITKQVPIQPVINFSDLPNYNYYQNFEESATDWFIKKTNEDDYTSWSLSTPGGSIINGASSGTKAWFTDVAIDKQHIENSQVVSPCFNMDVLSRPMIKMDIWSSPEEGRDGAVIQYSLDGGIAWSNLGDINDGLHWFNANSIKSKPANDYIGWSKSTNGWVSARHNLDNLINEKLIRFRIVYAADAQAIVPFNGFAFDNIWIGERQQLQVLEYFTNNTLTADNNYIHNLEVNDSLDLIPIHYYTAGDPLNYRVGTSSRIFFYGVSQVPYAYSNGIIPYDFAGSKSTAFEDSLDIASLKDPEISLSVGGLPNGINISLSTDVANNNIPNQDLMLVCAIVKKEVSGAYNVIKRFVPDQGGTVINKNGWVAGTEKKTQSITISYSPSADDLNNTYGVAFVQNLRSNKIYQAARFNPYIFTGVRPNDISSLVDVYPNPASTNLVIESEYEIQSIQVFDITGRFVGSEKPNQQRFDLPVDKLKGGIYILKGKTQKGDFVKKFVKQ